LREAAEVECSVGQAAHNKEHRKVSIAGELGVGPGQGARETATTAPATNASEP
jgi:hypothetical protein